jgi:hypothetical protein
MTLAARALGPECDPHVPLWTSRRSPMPSTSVKHFSMGWLIPSCIFVYRSLQSHGFCVLTFWLRFGQRGDSDLEGIK